MSWTQWLVECAEEGVTSTFCGRTQYTYTPPVYPDDTHTMAIVFGELFIPAIVAVELQRLAVARVISVRRDKVQAVPFSEREGNGPVTRGYLITWRQADVSLCARCWYVVNQTRCDHPFLRASLNGDIDTRTSLAEWAWAQCQGDFFQPQHNTVYTTAEAVFGD